MKSFIFFVVLIVLLLSFVVAAASFLGRDVLVSVTKLIEKQQLSSSKNRPIIATFAVISDTHSDTANTQKAVTQAKELGVDYLLHTGDWTTVGTIEELNAQKDIMESIGLPYWGVMGDHDRWQSQKGNFESVIGKSYEAFDKNNIHHILLDASDIELGLGKAQLDWLESDLGKNKSKHKLIFMHLPPYHPTSDRTIDSKGGKNDQRSQDTQRFLNLIKDQNVMAIFAGDHHFSEAYTEPTSGVKIVIVGAVTGSRNLQTPRFDLVDIYDNFTIRVREEVIN